MREIWQRVKYFYLRPPRTKMPSALEPIWTFPLLLMLSIDLNKSFAVLKNTFLKSE